MNQVLEKYRKYLILCSSMEQTLNGVPKCDGFARLRVKSVDTVEAAVLGAGVPADRVHLERFDVFDEPLPTETVTEEVTITVDRRTTVVPYRARNTVLQTARLAGLRAPSSCEIGSCGTCIARIVEGSVRMANNDVLDDEEVADGWVLTCQSMPTTRTVRVVYE